MAPSTMSRPSLLLTISVLALGCILVSSFSSESVLETSALAGRLSKLDSATFRRLSSWLSSWAPLRDMPKAERMQLLLEENIWKNDLVMWMFPQAFRDATPHLFHTWLRCWILCQAVYFVVGGLWSYYIYFCFGDVLFPPAGMPGWSEVTEQIKVSVLSMPLYSLLPALAEMAAEKGWTAAYPRVENVGLPLYLVYFVLYMTSVEFGVYWVHRLLHEIKWAYKYLHFDHHKYNKEHTLSPFAGLAFHPIDGILQAMPYVWTLFYCPMHFLTHEILLFATGVWTVNIHDNIDGKVWPIMGARFHTIHHTTYKTNYGHYFIFMDKWFGTLETPEDYDRRMAKVQ